MFFGFGREVVIFLWLIWFKIFFNEIFFLLIYFLLLIIIFNGSIYRGIFVEFMLMLDFEFVSIVIFCFIFEIFLCVFDI